MRTCLIMEVENGFVLWPQDAPPLEGKGISAPIDQCLVVERGSTSYPTSGLTSRIEKIFAKKPDTMVEPL